MGLTRPDVRQSERAVRPHTRALSVAPGAPSDEARLKVCMRCQYQGHEAFCPHDGLPLALPSTPAQAAAGGFVGSIFQKKYEIVALIGRGGQSDVYKARHTLTGHAVALKIMRPNVSREPAMVRRFHREAHASTRLAHPHTIRVFDVGRSDEGQLFLAMEYLDGRTLLDVLAAEAPLPPLRAARIARDVCQSLAEAHACGMVHRDLKPANIFLCQFDGLRDWVKVLDFGIVAFVSAGPAEQRITEPGLVLGTPKYLAPEQLLGHAVDARTDLYGLGLVLYETLTGQAPFASDPHGRGDFRRLRVEAPEVPPRVHGRAIPAALRALVMRLLAREPAHRVQSVEEAEETLTNVVRQLERDVDDEDRTTEATAEPRGAAGAALGAAPGLRPTRAYAGEAAGGAPALRVALAAMVNDPLGAELPATLPLSGGPPRPVGLAPTRVLLDVRVAGLPATRQLSRPRVEPPPIPAEALRQAAQSGATRAPGPPPAPEPLPASPASGGRAALPLSAVAGGRWAFCPTEVRVFWALTWVALAALATTVLAVVLAPIDAEALVPEAGRQRAAAAARVAPRVPLPALALPHAPAAGAAAATPAGQAARVPRPVLVPAPAAAPEPTPIATPTAPAAPAPVLVPAAEPAAAPAATRMAADVTASREPAAPEPPAAPAVAAPDRPAKRARGAASRRRATAPVPAGYVGVRIESLPSGAEVLTNGGPLGRTPLVVPVRRGTSKVLLLRLAGYEPTRTILAPGDGPVLRVLLTRPRKASPLPTPQPGAGRRLPARLHL